MLPAFFRTIAFVTCSILSCSIFGQDAPTKVSSNSLLSKPDSWFQSEEGKTICQNIVTWQNKEGGWWKALNVAVPRDPSSPIPKDDWHQNSTIDNRATYTEIRVLSRAFRLTNMESFKNSALLGIDFLLQAQYPNGGWPQRFPLPNNYGRHITFNDGAMLGVMRLLSEIRDSKADFLWVDAARREKARVAFELGVDCILRSQFVRKGIPTAWCQQHDAKDLAPVSARAYELPSLSGSESTDILMLLMEVEKPNERIIHAVRSGIEWIQASKIEGKELRSTIDANGKKDRALVDEKGARSLWARFYDLETNLPFYCGRDGVKKDRLEDIESERRNGYSWIGVWGNKALDRYRHWSKIHAP